MCKIVFKRIRKENIYGISCCVCFGKPRDCVKLKNRFTQVKNSPARTIGHFCLPHPVTVSKMRKGSRPFLFMPLIAAPPSGVKRSPQIEKKWSKPTYATLFCRCVSHKVESSRLTRQETVSFSSLTPFSEEIAGSKSCTLLSLLPSKTKIYWFAGVIPFCQESFHRFT